MTENGSIHYAAHPATASSKEVVPWPLSFHIPPSLSRPLHGRPLSGQYWSHTLYRGPGGKPVQVLYSITKQESEQLAQKFLHEAVLGFDGEWYNWYPDHTAPLKSVVSLVQIASEDKIGLFHIARHDGTTPEDLIAPSLRRIIESPNIIKTGNNIIGADFKRLRQYFKLKPQGGLELSDLHKSITKSPYNGLVALAKQVQIHLGLPLAKGEVRGSNWMEPLNEEQKVYAAADAYAGFMLYHCMNAKRVAMGLSMPYSHTYDARGKVITSQEHLEALKKHQQEAHSFAELDPASQRLFHLLASNRQALACMKDIPPYLIAPDATLRALAQARPTTYADLEQVKGVGPHKMSDYGAAWIAIISHFVENNPTESTQQNHRILSEKTPSSLNSTGPRPAQTPNRDHKRAASASGEEVCASLALLQTGSSFASSSLPLSTRPAWQPKRMRCGGSFIRRGITSRPVKLGPVDYVPDVEEEALWAEAFKSDA